MKPTQVCWKALAALLAVGSAGCSDNNEGVDAGISVETEIVNAQDPSMILGTATIRQQLAGGVVVDFDIAPNDVISGGEHAIHIHENGSCDAADTDNDGQPEPAGAAGGHYNPTNVGHGEDNGPHAGDSENYNYAFDADGSFDGEVQFPMLGLFEQNPLLVDGGTAIIIHAGTDDMVTDPDGESGPRVACAVIAS